MRTVWHSLLWKEWHEHKWKLAALTALVYSVLFLIWYWFGENHADTLYLVTASLTGYSFAATFFIAMAVAGGESSRKTMPFLQSLPLPMWQPAAVKLLLAGFTLIMPLAVGVIGVYLPFLFGSFDDALIQEAIEWDLRYMGQPWGISDWFTARTVGTVLGILSFLLWMAAAGVNRSDEIRAGAVGFLTIAVVWACFAYLYSVADEHDMPTFKSGLRVAMVAAPGGPAIANREKNVPPRSAASWAKESTPFLLTALIGHTAVGAWYLSRFGRVKFKPERGGTGRSAAQSGTSLGLPRRSQLSAIAWKQMRETGPLAVFALAAILMITAVLLWVDDTSRFHFSQLFVQFGASISFFVVIVAGIGLYLEDLNPELNNFWRSRPTNLSLWFGVKYATGLLVLVTVLGIPMLLAGVASGELLGIQSTKQVIAGSLFFGWFFIEAYSLAMATQCLVRQPLYAAGLTFATIMFSTFAFSVVFHQPHWGQTVATMILALAATIVLAWQAVRHDWGWKH